MQFGVFMLTFLQYYTRKYSVNSDLKIACMNLVWKLLNGESSNAVWRVSQQRVGAQLNSKDTMVKLDKGDWLRRRTDVSYVPNNSAGCSILSSICVRTYVLYLRSIRCSGLACPIGRRFYDADTVI